MNEDLFGEKIKTRHKSNVKFELSLIQMSAAFFMQIIFIESALMSVSWRPWCVMWIDIASDICDKLEKKKESIALCLIIDKRVSRGHLSTKLEQRRDIQLYPFSNVPTDLKTHAVIRFTKH